MPLDGAGLDTLTIDDIRAALAQRRPQLHEVVPDVTRVHAAVAIIARPAARDIELLFIRRAAFENDPWSGDIAFPGGRIGSPDEPPHAAAERETREEVGIDLDAHGKLLAELPELPAIARGKRTGMIITPYVFALDREVPIAFDHDEVAEALWVPFGPLARRDNAGTLKYTIEGYEVDLPCLHIEGRVLWGLTHRMLEMMIAAMCGAP